MIQKNFNNSWEKNIYSKGNHCNRYPYDLVVSIISNNFFHLPKKTRGKMKVLDLGCGTGNHAKFLAENGFSVYGIDGSKSAIDICKKRFKKWGLKSNFTQGNFLNLPYNNDFFDLVLDRESLYANYFNDIKTIVDKIYNILKSSGYFISFMYSNYHSNRKLGKQIEKNTYNNFKAESSFYKTGTTHFTDLEEIKTLFKKFKIENINRHSLNEIYNKKKKLGEFDEYIIIVKKIKI